MATCATWITCPVFRPIRGSQSHLQPGKLSIIKKPGETFDHVISDLIEERQKLDIIRHVKKVSEEGDFLSLDEAEEA